jgi:hypothetical protein
MSFRCNALAAIAAAGLLTACATKSVLPPAQPFEAGAAPGELVHKHTGFAFPSRIGSFLRVTGHQYDALGRDISVGYNGDIPVVVTVYVYPAGQQTLEADLVEQSALVLGAHPGATVTGSSTVHVTPAGVDAKSVAFAFSADFYGKNQPLHSELVLARHGASFVKYRITYPASLSDLGAEDSGKFLEYFAWP